MSLRLTMRTIALLLVICYFYGFVSSQNDNDESIRTFECYVNFTGNSENEENLSSENETFAYRNFPMSSLFKQNPSFNYKSNDETDIFDFVRDSYPSPKGHIKKAYDFIIIGAGSAGYALASRLSEENNWTVLVIEAGVAESILTDVPLIAASFQSTNYNWGYRMEKIDGICMGMDDQRCSWPRGKAIGGSSVINYMIYTRGRKLDWDRIAEAGNPGWSYDDVLPYYLKSERANLKGLENSTYHNRDGLLSVEDIGYRTPLLKSFLEAGVELGHKIVDYNKPNEMGFSPVQTNTHDGKRHSAAKAFLHPFKERSNLHILSKSRAVKINIDGETKTAKSVEYVRNRLHYRVRAKKEIIISAGAFASPQLLMLSGVGPKAHLEELEIPVVQDLKVGETLYDHVCYPGLIFRLNETGLGLVESKALTIKNFINLFSYGDGPLAIPGGVEGLAYIKTKISEEATEHPDLELMFLSGCISSDASQAIRKGLKISDEFFHSVYGEIVEKDCWSIFPMLLTPQSRGYLRLKDKNPFHWPKFYQDHFSNRRDLLTLVEGIKYAIKISETAAFREYGSKLYDKHFPTCYDHTFGTDEYWSCAARTLSTTLHHQIATCKMGPDSDPDAVVDNELRVHGIKKLRVADTSIIPKPITAHTNAPAIMIGEKLADILKNTWK